MTVGGQFAASIIPFLSYPNRSSVMFRLWIFTLTVLLLCGQGVGPVRAQNQDTTSQRVDVTGRNQGAGTVVLTNWPKSLRALRREMGPRAPYLLPRIDSLALDYRYSSSDSTSHWTFSLGWRPGESVLHRGKVRPLDKGPSNLRMVNVELRAAVFVDGERAGAMIVAVDTMSLPSFPNKYSFEVTVPHERVFLDMSSEDAHQALREGVSLGLPTVERMGFVSDDGSASRQGRGPEVRKQRGREPSIYEPRTRIFIGWRVAPRPYYVGKKDGRRTVEPRGETIGRGTASGETADGGGRRSARSDEENDKKGEGARSTDDEDRDDDEEDTSLQAPALGAAAAIGFLAYAGGTVGIYGRGDTPLGLAAGYTRPTWGIQLAAAVNGAVLSDEPDQALTIKALGFYDVFSSRVQPAIGLGVHVDPQRGQDVRPSASVGLAGNLGKVVVYGGVDVLQATPEVGLTYNFRYRPELEAKR